MRTFRSSLLALCALPLCAQGFSVSGAGILALDSLKKVTDAPAAIILGGDYETHFSGTEIPVRAGISLAQMPGHERFGLKTSLFLAQVHGDVFLCATPKLAVVAGLSLNTYSMTRTGEENRTDALDVDHHFPVGDAKGVKFGFRLGLDYRLDKAWSLELMLQQTELAGKDLTGDVKAPDGTELVRQGAINPAWLQLGVTYRF
jgi:hypothetical protein